MVRKPVEWLYKPANLDIDDYRQELTNLLAEMIPDAGSRLPTEFLPVSHDVFKKHCTGLVGTITSWGLIDRLAEIAIIFSNPNTNYPIHRDFITWKARNIALNLPLLNCENSNTVWYDVKLTGENLKNLLGDSSYVDHALAVDESTAVEIGRCNSAIPHWINVYVPHAPRINHSNVRMAISIRFYPELFDIIQSGKFDELMVKSSP